MEENESSQEIMRGAMDSGPGKPGDNELHLAVRAGSVTRVQEILESCDPELVGELLNKQNKECETALFVAAEMGNAEVVREILMACELKAVKIEDHMDVGVGYAFSVAAKLGHQDVVKEMLRAVPRMVRTTERHDITALHIAAYFGQLDIVILLMRTDASLAWISTDKGKTALHLAAEMGCMEVVTLLLEMEPRIVSMTDTMCRTALHKASKRQNADIVRMLLRSNGGASAIFIHDRMGYTPLHLAVLHGKTINVETLLLHHENNVNAVNAKGETALDMAHNQDNEELANILTRFGALTKEDLVYPYKEAQFRFSRMDSESSRNDNLDALLQDENAEPCDLRLQYLIDITENFSDNRELGRGGFGVVYKGTLPNGETIAVKNLVSWTGIQEKQFKNEVDSLMRVRHQNIIRFIGYCYETWMKYIDYSGKPIFAETPQRLLCFEYMANGSLDRYISEESNGLDWHKRYEIIRGICCGLNYLHEECKTSGSIIHLDLKPANILLDDNMLPKIADFGLSRLLNDQKTRTCTTLPLGSLGYIAPEYLFKGIITTKADIYSLGVIVIEIVSGRKISPYDTGKSCDDFVELVSRNWRNRLEASPSCTCLEIYYQQIKTCLEIGLSCTKFEPEERPSITEVIESLYT